MSKCSVVYTLAIRWGWKSNLIRKKGKNSIKDKGLNDSREGIWLCARNSNNVAGKVL